MRNKFVKIFVFSLLMIGSFKISAQTFDFENNSLAQWSQSAVNHWEITNSGVIGGSYSLHHGYDNPASGRDQISTIMPNYNYNDSVTWEFKIRYGYNPSSLNNWAVFLVADKAAEGMVPGADINGFMVGVNFFGSDDTLKLWQLHSGNLSELIKTNINWETVVGTETAVIRVSRKGNGEWFLYFTKGTDNKNLKFAGSVVNDNVPSGNNFGIYYKYSSQQDRKLWIDDISINGTIVVDTIPPTIDTAWCTSLHEIQVVFSEPIEISGIKKTSFELAENHQLPDSIQVIDSRTIKLYYSQPLSENTFYTLECKDVKDISGNSLDYQARQVFWHPVQRFDVLITEIMFDPEPSNELPEYEYAEIYNHSPFPINLKGWSISINGHKYYFLDGSIQSGEYKILTSYDGAYYFSDIPVFQVFSNAYLLNNEGASLVLKDNNNNTISFVNYSPDWVTEDFKKEGGWSLEMMDVNNLCAGPENWAASIDKSGGTPGRKNSVAKENPDVVNPFIKYTTIVNDSSVVLHFSEPLDSAIAFNPSNYTFSESLAGIRKINQPKPDFSEVELVFAKPMMAGLMYELTLDHTICDCAGNFNTSVSLKFGLPQTPDSLDVVFNEILPDPFPNGAKFVEFYNKSNKIIDAGQLVFIHIDKETNQISSSNVLFPLGYVLLPLSYVAATDDLKALQGNYKILDNSTVYENPDLLSLDEKYSFLLINKSNGFVDQLNYSSSWHFPVINNDEGMSLERINPAQPTNQAENWQSASGEVLATPGYKNSQYKNAEPANQSSGICITPEVFTPDRDGQDDVVTIQFNSDYSGWMATIMIFNSAGKLVKYLANNSLLGNSSAINWNGCSVDNMLQSPGIYVFYISLFDNKGHTKEFKKTCVLGVR